MTNSIAINSDLSFRRVAKSGKVTVRGALGAMMSGNASERATLSRIAAKNLIANNTFGPVMAEISRVFSLSAIKRKAKETGDGIYEVNGTFTVWQGKTSWTFNGTWDAVTSYVYCQAVLAKVSALEEKGSVLKGERVLVAEFADELVRHIDAKAAAKAAALSNETAQSE